MFARHTVPYDQLSHFFYESDVYDTHNDTWLSTDRRKELLLGSPFVSVPVIHSCSVKAAKDLDLSEMASRLTPFQTEGPVEGLFVKAEAKGKTVGWYKYINPEFMQAIFDSGQHWKNRSLVENTLAPNSIFEI